MGQFQKITKPTYTVFSMGSPTVTRKLRIPPCIDKRHFPKSKIVFVKYKKIEDGFHLYTFHL